MATQSRLEGDHHVNGTLSAKAMTIPAASVGDEQLKTGQNFPATKFQHQFPIVLAQDDGSDVVSQTVLAHIFYGGAELVALEVRPTTAPTGGDKQFTVDVEKAADASGSWSSILSGAVVVNSSSADNTQQIGTLTTTTALDGEALRFVITASGSTGSQGQGFVVVLWVRENPA